MSRVAVISAHASPSTSGWPARSPGGCGPGRSARIAGLGPTWPRPAPRQGNGRPGPAARARCAAGCRAGRRRPGWGGRPADRGSWCWSRRAPVCRPGEGGAGRLVEERPRRGWLGQGVPAGLDEHASHGGAVHTGRGARLAPAGKPPCTRTGAVTRLPRFAGAGVVLGGGDGIRLRGRHNGGGGYRTAPCCVPPAEGPATCLTA
jgi:hypothetical protein